MVLRGDKRSGIKGHCSIARSSREKLQAETLDKDEAYRTATSHRHRTTPAFFYLQPKAFSARLAALRAAVQSSPTPGETTMLEKMRAAFGFDAILRMEKYAMCFSWNAKAEE